MLARALLVAAAAAVAAAADIAGSCTAYDGAFCAGFTADSVFVYTGATVAEIEANLTLSYGTAFGSGFLSEQCFTTAKVALCADSFPACASADELDPAAPIPTLPCRSVCDAVLVDCADEIENFRLLLGDPDYEIVDCAAVSGSTGVPEWPADDAPVVLPVNGTTVERACADLADAARPPVDMVCPGPLLSDPDWAARYPEFVSSCVPPCIYPIYSDSEWDATIDSIVAFGFLSLIGSTLVIATWLIFPQKRLYPGKVVLYIAISTVAIEIATIMNASDTQDLWCESPSRPRFNTYTGACFLQGALVQFGSLASLTWWFIFSCFMYLAIVKDDRDLERFAPWAHALGWGFPLATVIVLWATGSFGFFNVVAWCWIADAPFYDIDYVTFWGPGLFFVAAGGVLMIRSMLHIYKVMSQVRGNQRKTVRQQIRLLVFMLVFCYIFAFMVGFRFNSQANNDEYTRKLVAWYTCWLVSPSTPDFDGCPVPDTIPFAAFYLNFVNVAAAGLILAATVLITDENIKLWRGFIVRGTRHAADSASTRKMGAPKSASTPRGPGRPAASSRAELMGPPSSSSSPSPAATPRGGPSQETDSTSEPWHRGIDSSAMSRSEADRE